MAGRAVLAFLAKEGAMAKNVSLFADAQLDSGSRQRSLAAFVGPRARDARCGQAFFPIGYDGSNLPLMPRQCSRL